MLDLLMFSESGGLLVAGRVIDADGSFGDDVEVSKEFQAQPMFFNHYSGERRLCGI